MFPASARLMPRKATVGGWQIRAGLQGAPSPARSIGLVHLFFKIEPLD